ACAPAMRPMTSILPCEPSRPGGDEAVTAPAAKNRSGGGGLRRRGLAELLDQARDGVADLGTLPLPVLQPGEVESQRLPALGRLGIVEAHALDEAAVTRIARVGHDHIEEGPLSGTAAG